MSDYYDFIQCIKDGNPTALDYLAKKSDAHGPQRIVGCAEKVVGWLLGRKEDGTYEFPSVAGHVAANDNETLLGAAENGHWQL